LPVAAIGRIVVVVVVAVMHRQFPQVGAGELARAAAADPRVHLQGALAVVACALVRSAPGICDDAVEVRLVGGGHGLLEIDRASPKLTGGGKASQRRNIPTPHRNSYRLSHLVACANLTTATMPTPRQTAAASHATILPTRSF